MKKFKALKFKDHGIGGGAKQARVQFDNGYGASIVTGTMFYTNTESPFELAVLTADGSLCYSTPITDDVIGYLTAAKVDELLVRISELPCCEN